MTEEIKENPQDEGTGGGIGGWLIGIGLLGAAGGGGYYWYYSTQKKRRAAQRAAQKKAAEQRKTQGKNRNGQTAGRQGQPVSAQNAAKVRTGSYSGKGSRTSAKPAQTDAATRKSYGGNVENPYGRYSTASTEDEANYTASFKPGSGTDRTARGSSKTTDWDVPDEPGTTDDPKA